MDPDFWTSLTICVALVAVALWLVRTHWEHWIEVDADTSLQPRERDHLKRRYRRRLQTSTMLGFVGVAILGGRLFPPGESGLVGLLYWSGVTLLVLWMALLAMADMLATRIHYGSQRRKADVEQARLEAQLRRVQEAQAEPSGDPPSQAPGKKSDPDSSAAGRKSS